MVNCLSSWSFVFIVLFPFPLSFSVRKGVAGQQCCLPILLLEMSSKSIPDKERRVGDYILGVTLGQGSFGKVKLATNAKTNETVMSMDLERNYVF